MAQRKSTKSKLTAEQQAQLFPAPKPHQDLCGICKSIAPFAMRNVNTNDREHYCSMHVPSHFNIKPSLPRLLEEEFLKTNSAGCASNAPAV